MGREPMRRSSPIVLFVGLLGGFAWMGSAAQAAATATAPTATVEVIDVEGAIDRPLLAYVNDRLDAAERSGAIVLLQLDTSGSLHQDGVALADRVAHLSVPVITWTGPAPAAASGAGLLLVYASSLAAVSPGVQTGPLFPIDLAEPDLEPPGLTARIQGWLDARGKDTRLERLDEPLTGNEAVELDVVQVAAVSVLDVLDKVDGREVQTPGGPVTLSTKLARNAGQAEQGTVDVRFDNLGPVKRILHGVASPTMVYVLIVLGISALAFELTQPGFGFAGFAGLLLVVLGGYGAWVVPPSIVGGIALLGGIGLMIWDVHLRKLGALTALGLTAFAAGSFLAWNPDVAHAIRVSPWLIVATIVAALLYYGFGLTVSIQSRDRIMATQRGLIGLVGEARGKLSPEGPVFVKGAMWRGRSAGEPILPGQRVRVRGVDGLVLRVEAEPDGEQGVAPG
jgi:membrane-bound serine protease (ClpP class)